MSLPKNAIAKVKALDDAQLVGVAEIASIFEMYGYRRDSANAALWWLLEDGPENAGAAIEVLDEGEVFIVYSRSRDNAGNVNHIARQAGWMSCALTSLDHDANELMLENLLQVEPVSEQMTILQADGDASTMPAAPALVAAPLVEAVDADPGEVAMVRSVTDLAEVGSGALHQTGDGHDEVASLHDARPALSAPGTSSDDALLSDLEANFARIATLTQQLAESESARQDAENRKRHLEQELLALQGDAAGAGAPAAAAAARPRGEREAALIDILERHLLGLVDTTKLESDVLVQELKKSGYDVVVKLTHAA